MWSQNALTERLNLDWPIFQAAMGNLTTPALAAGVSNAGAVGGLGMFGFNAEEFERRVAGFRQQSGKCLNVSYLLFESPPDLAEAGAAMRQGLQALYDAKGMGPISDPKPIIAKVGAADLAMLKDAKPEVVTFHFGLPDHETVQALRSAGCFIICSATTVAEARILEAGGADAIIAQGTEAGGHRGTFTDVDISQQPGLISLLPQIVDAVSVPVIAAGGIADGRGIAAAMMLGASAVQLGTAFLRCGEAAVPDTYRATLETANDADTLVTSLASGKPARAVRNRVIDEIAGINAEPLPFPSQLELTWPLGDDGDQDMQIVLAGQSAALTRELSAADLVATLAAETTQRLKSFA